MWTGDLPGGRIYLSRADNSRRTSPEILSTTLGVLWPVARPRLAGDRAQHGPDRRFPCGFSEGFARQTTRAESRPPRCFPQISGTAIAARPPTLRTRVALARRSQYTELS